jgi:hypothetical protein
MYDDWISTGRCACFRRSFTLYSFYNRLYLPLRHDLYSPSRLISRPRRSFIRCPIPLPGLPTPPYPCSWSYCPASGISRFSSFIHSCAILLRRYPPFYVTSNLFLCHLESFPYSVTSVPLTHTPIPDVHSRGVLRLPHPLHRSVATFPAAASLHRQILVFIPRSLRWFSLVPPPRLCTSAPLLCPPIVLEFIVTPDL